jgi:hypothetical protein
MCVLLYCIRICFRGDSAKKKSKIAGMWFIFHNFEHGSKKISYYFVQCQTTKFQFERIHSKRQMTNMPRGTPEGLFLSSLLLTACNKSVTPLYSKSVLAKAAVLSSGFSWNYLHGNNEIQYLLWQLYEWAHIFSFTSGILSSTMEPHGDRYTY